MRRRQQKCVADHQEKPSRWLDRLKISARTVDRSDGRAPIELPAFLPGTLSLSLGRPRDYTALEQFHYAAKRPATWAQVWTIRYRAEALSDPGSRIVAVGVLSYPVPSCLARERFLGRVGYSRNENLIFANANIRTISRVVVHPQFRSLGLSTILIRCLCDHCDTRYIEAIARMGRAHPLFERAGMRRIDPANPDEPLYFVMDRSLLKPQEQTWRGNPQQ